MKTMTEEFANGNKSITPISTKEYTSEELVFIETCEDEFGNIDGEYDTISIECVEYHFADGSVAICKNGYFN